MSLKGSEPCSVEKAVEDYQSLRSSRISHAKVPSRIIRQGRVLADTWILSPGTRGGCFSNSDPPTSFWSVQQSPLAASPGYSSPIVTGHRIFLTAFHDGGLETVCMDRANGREDRWLGDCFRCQKWPTDLPR